MPIVGYIKKIKMTNKTNKAISAFLIFITLFLTNSLNTYSQPRNFPSNRESSPSGIVSGLVVDSETKKPIMRATVTLHNPATKKQITGGYTDKTGKFNLKVGSGNYYVRVNFVGYDSVITKEFSITASDSKHDCGTISLRMQAVRTQEVTVTAEREAIEVGLDRKVFNVEQDVSSLGGSAIDVLANIPSITVDQDDNVSLRGSSDVRVMIDGRVTNMSASDALASIPASMISSVELITNPGARYDADGTAGIINIVTTRERNDGINAMVNIGGGVDDSLKGRFNGTANINYNYGKWNFFANLSGRMGNRTGGMDLYRAMYDRDNVGSIASEIFQHGENNGNNMFLSGKVGADYNFTKNDVLTYSFRYNGMKREEDNISTLLQITKANDTLQNYRQIQNSKPPFGINQEHTLSYKHNFEQKGHELYVDLFYNTFDRNSLTNYEQNNYIDNMLYKQKNSSDVLSTNFASQVDYAVPIGTNFKLEVGGKYSNRNTTIEQHYDSLNGDVWLNNPNRSDNFEYLEDIIALYVTGSSKIGDNLKYNIGLRSETSIITFNSKIAPANSFEDNYTLFFPSIYLAYDFNTHHEISANLASRMRRPNYWDLNPTIDYSDPLNLRTGNSALRPESHYLGEFGYMANYDATTFTATLFYRYSTDGIERYTEVLNGDTTLSRPMNISSSLRTGLDFILMQKIFDWWKIDASFSLFNNELDATNLSENISKKSAFNWNTRFNSQMTFGMVTISVSGGYRSKMLRAQGEMKPNWNIDLGSRITLSKDLSLNLRIQDIFNTRQWGSYEEIPNVMYSEFNRTRNSRSYYLGLNYRINNYKQKKERSSDTEERMEESSDM